MSVQRAVLYNLRPHDDSFGAFFSCCIGYNHQKHISHNSWSEVVSMNYPTYSRALSCIAHVGRAAVAFILYGAATLRGGLLLLLGLVSFIMHCARLTRCAIIKAALQMHCSTSTKWSTHAIKQKLTSPASDAFASFGESAFCAPWVVSEKDVHLSILENERMPALDSCRHLLRSPRCLHRRSWAQEASPDLCP